MADDEGRSFRVDVDDGPRIAGAAPSDVLAGDRLFCHPLRAADDTEEVEVARIKDAAEFAVRSGAISAT